MRIRDLATLVVLLSGSAVLGQDAPVATSPAELLEKLRAAGVAIPEGFVANEDGSVSVPAPPEAPPAAPGAADAPSVETGEPVPGADAPVIEKPEWDTKLNIGLNISAGNTESTGFAATVLTTRKTKSSELFLDSGYFHATQDGDQTENQFTAGVLHDWIFPGSRWLVFADARYDYNDFASYQHRVAAHGGVGYKVIDKEDLSLTLRAGLGASREFGSGNDEIVPEALLGADFRWQIAENQSLEIVHRTFPSLKNSGEFRTLTSAAWNLAIAKDDGLSFTVTALHEYLSEVDPGTEHNDLKLFAGLTYDF